MKERIFKRELEDKIARYIDRKEIVGIRGARQAGKTTLLKKIAENIEGSKAFVNLDLPRYRFTLEENPVDFVKRFKKEEKLFLFLDETQRVKNAGEKLKIIYDEFSDAKIFISGSSSLELKTNVLPFLVGRLLLFNLYTFSFGEFLQSKDDSLKKLFKEKHTSLKKFIEGDDEIAPPSLLHEFMNYWKEYVVFGGYPEVVKSKAEEDKKIILKNIYDLYLEKDIVSFFRIEDSSKFIDFVKSTAFNISNLLNLSSLISDLKISYRRGEEFLSILEHTYILQLVKPFHKNLITELKKASKIYFLDLGIRNAAINNFMNFDSRDDRGKLTENFVFRELVTNFDDYKINYWRTTGKAEVDFVLSKHDTIIPIEVKLSGERISKSFYSFLKAYKPEKAIIATLNKFKKQKIQNTDIWWVPVVYF